MARRHHLNILLASQTRYDLGQICHFLLNKLALIFDLLIFEINATRSISAIPECSLCSHFFPCLLSWHIARIPYKPSSFLPLATAFWRPLLLAGLSFHLFPPGYEGSWWTELTKFTLLFPLSFSWSTNYWHVIRHLTRGLLYHGWHDRLLSSRTFSSLSVVLRTPLSPSVCHSEPQLLYLAGLLL